jgi:hypothetical protein
MTTRELIESPEMRTLVETGEVSLVPRQESARVGNVLRGSRAADAGVRWRDQKWTVTTN